MSLASRHCVPCRKGAPALEPARAEALLAELPGWSLREGRLVRAYRLPSPAAALALLQAIAHEAEAEGHHPELRLRGPELEVSLHTWVAAGLTENDFVLAARIDALPGARAGWGHEPPGAGRG